jgi:hypothetical protein
MDVKAFREYYEFDDDDLYANQQGRLSDRQYKTLSAQALQMKKFSKTGAVVALVAAAVLPCILLPVGVLTLLTQDWKTTLIAWGGALLWLVVFGGAGLALLRSARAAGKTNWDVSRAAGPVELQKVERTTGGQHSRTYTVTFVKFGDSDFELDDELVGRIQAGDNIAAYFAAGQIVSIEQLPALGPSQTAA